MSKLSNEEKADKRSKRMDIITQQLVNTINTTSKQLLWLFSINGVIWIWCSYILAFMGRENIAEALSSNVCTVVLGQIGFYLISKTVENVFQYNDIFIKRRLKLGIEEPATTTPTPTVTTTTTTTFGNPGPAASSVVATPVTPVAPTAGVSNLETTIVEVTTNEQRTDENTDPGSEQPGENRTIDPSSLF